MIERPTLDQQLPRPRGHYDVVVIGARAAGAATAMLHARRGLRVLCIDKSTYGSDTLSSHALMRGAIKRLHRWGLLGRVWDAGTPVITKTLFRYGEELVEIDIPTHGEIPGLAAPRRTVLDPILVDAAIDAGAAIHHSTRLLSIDTDLDGRVRGANLGFADGSTGGVSTDLLVGADGLHSTVARQLDVPVTHQGHHASAYILQYFSDVELPIDRYCWLYRPGLGAGVIPTQTGTFCVFAAMPPNRFNAEARFNPTVAMAEVLRALDPGLMRALHAGRTAGPIRSWPGVCGQFRKPHGPGWALVGDAGYFKDPFAAHGISDAFRDAELLTDATITGDFVGYERLRDQLSMPLFAILERIAGYEWDLQSLPGLHLQLSHAMRDEDAAGSALRRESVGV
ncbi:MAG TPA: FAD-dependent monooxygenase [Ilumatobacteraceae bacterium]|nr:FAD-dependent monooxygenase [Ilumatobacteraceae bacterium]